MSEPLTTPTAFCRPGEGAACCAFLMLNTKLTGHDLVCAKGTNMEEFLRMRRETKKLKAQGDNCSGPPNFIPPASAAGRERETEAKTWRCFHCDEVFEDEESARLHFGDGEDATAGCVLKLDGKERAILACLREAEARNRLLLSRAQEAEYEGESNAGLRAELKRLFGASDAWGCWCKLDYAEGRILALEEQLARLAPERGGEEETKR